MRYLAAALRPPLRDRRFWIVQLLVVGIAGLHELIDASQLLQPFDLSVVAPVALFLVPVVYAALIFGLTGSAATAAWVTVLTIPDPLFTHPEPSHVADLVQLFIVDAVAVFVGLQIERERAARREVEETEARYRSLFETNTSPIVVAEPDGRVHDANPAAGRLLGALPGRSLDDLVGAQPAAALLAGEPAEVINLRDHSFRPLAGRLGQGLVQVVFLDVTEEQRRQRRLDAYAAHVLQGHEDERQRIAQELHDEPVQQLIQLCRMLDAVPGGEPSREFAESIARGLREMARGLRPPSLDDLGLVASLRQLVGAFEQRTGIPARLQVEGRAGRLEADAELGLFRITQEALRNVERHAGAHQVSVALAFDGAVSLQVEDDGAGLRASPSAGGGLGLLGMQERASLLGGRLSVDAGPKGGTRVRVELPRSRPRRPPRPGARQSRAG